MATGALAGLIGLQQLFADKVVRLLTDQKVAQQLGDNGLARVQSQYSWAAKGKALESAIQSVMSSHMGTRIS